MSEDRVGAVAKAARMEEIIRAYIQACNDADAEAIAACFCSDAVHYFPAGDPRRTKWLGAATIGSNFAKIVEQQGVCWRRGEIIAARQLRSLLAQPSSPDRRPEGCSPPAEQPGAARRCGR